MKALTFSFPTTVVWDVPVTRDMPWKASVT
jgi:hypothetical protein